MIDALKPFLLAGDPTKPTLLLLHGFMGHGEDWVPIATALGVDHQVLGVNLPGHSADWAKYTILDFDMATCAAALNAHLDAMQLPSVALAGYSMGGRFGLYLALHFPKRYRRVVLESASPGLNTEEKREARRHHDAQIAQQLRSMAPKSEAFRVFLDAWYAQPLFESLHAHPERREARIEHILGWADPPMLSQSLQAMGTGTQPNLWPDLAEYQTPTLLLAGERDRKFRIIAEDMCACCPTMATEIFTNCGHNIHLENPDAYLTAMRSFLCV